MLHAKHALSNFPARRAVQPHGAERIATRRGGPRAADFTAGSAVGRDLDFPPFHFFDESFGSAFPAELQFSNLILLFSRP
jgi:hypothetical protein